jgi:radical S-adenosyl methionine domain-containing protein 2
LEVTYEICPATRKTCKEEDNIGHRSFNEPSVQNYSCDMLKVRSVNWHITTKCNYNCRFCFAKRLDKEIKDLRRSKEILNSLKDLGIQKINFTGGEPLLHPLLLDLVKIAKGLDFTTSLGSNGYLLNREVIANLAPYLDWVGFSLDSAYENVEATLGRGNGDHVRRIIELADAVHEEGINLKINTVITRLNYTEDIRPLIEKLKPLRWKIFQVLHIQGQNDSHFYKLSVTKEQFDHFRLINQNCPGKTVAVFEKNHDMIDSYFMISPGGRIFTNHDKTNDTLIPLKQISKARISQLLDIRKYEKRGGLYSW